MTVPVTTPADAIARARSATVHGIKYRLGAGGMNAESPVPWGPDRACDCSGYVAWVLGHDRQTANASYLAFNGGWLNTDAIKADALKSAAFFTQIAAPRVGCIVVYGAIKGKRSYGHVGMVTAVDAGRVTSVIHCSSGNYRKYGDAIRETGPEAFQQPDQIFAWPVQFGDSGPTFPRFPVRTWVLVTASSLNLRSAPNTDAPPVGAVKAGDMLTVQAVTQDGLNVSGNKAWYETTAGAWAWAGGTDRPTPNSGLLP